MKQEQISDICFVSRNPTHQVMKSLQVFNTLPPILSLKFLLLVQQPGQQLLATLSCLTGTIMLALSDAAEEMIFGFMALLSVLGMFQETPNFDLRTTGQER